MSGLRSRTIWVVGVVALLLVILVAALPIAAARVLESMLRDRGATEVVIDDIDVNLFAGTVGFYGVVAVNASGRLQADSLEIDASLKSIFSRRVEVFDLSLSGGHLDLIQGQDGTWQLGSLRIDADMNASQIVDPELAPPWGLGAHRISIRDFVVTLQSEQLVREFELRKLYVERAFSWQPKQSSSFELSLRSGEAELDVTLEATPFDELLQISGDLELKNLLVHNIRNPSLAAAFEDLKGVLSAKLEFDLRLAPGDSLDLELDGEFSLQQAVLAERDVRFEMDEIEWRGAASAQIDLTEVGEPASFTVTGEVALAELQVLNASDEFKLLSLGALGLQNLNATERLVTIERVTLEDFSAHLQRLAGGALRLPRVMATAEDTAALDGQARASEAPYVARIGELVLEGDSRIHFRDEDVDPVFVAELRVSELRVKNIDTAGESPLSVDLVASSTNADQILVAGSVAPFVAEPSADLEVDLEGFDLSRLSPYLPGYNVERGRLALQSNARMVAGDLDIQNKVTIDRLKIAGKTEDEDVLVAGAAAMPLDVMLDLLRDSDDRIAFEIPITGNLDSFDVGLNQVIRKATQSALQRAAFSYVKTALQPLGTILFAANLAGKAARPRFESVLFAAGSSLPVGEQDEYVRKLAELLETRPSLHLTLCGVATKQDEVALTPADEPAPLTVVLGVSEETLLALAKTRADAVKEAITSRGVDTERLFDCRPSFEPAEDDVPRVEVML